METKLNKSGLDRPYALLLITDITLLQPLFIAPHVDITFSDQHNLCLITLRANTFLSPAERLYDNNKLDFNQYDF